MEDTISIIVRSRPEKVFAYLSNPENAPEWVPYLVSVQKITDGDVGVGTRYVEIVQIGKWQNEAELEITEYNPPHVFAYKGKGGPSRFTARFTIKPEGDGTRIEHRYSLRMTGIFVILSPFTNRWVRINAQTGMDSLQSIFHSKD